MTSIDDHNTLLQLFVDRAEILFLKKFYNESNSEKEEEWDNRVHAYYLSFLNNTSDPEIQVSRDELYKNVASLSESHSWIISVCGVLSHSIRAVSFIHSISYNLFQWLGQKARSHTTSVCSARVLQYTLKMAIEANARLKYSVCVLADIGRKIHNFDNITLVLENMSKKIDDVTDILIVLNRITLSDNYGVIPIDDIADLSQFNSYDCLLVYYINSGSEYTDIISTFVNLVTQNIETFSQMTLNNPSLHPLVLLFRNMCRPNPYTTDDLDRMTLKGCCPQMWNEKGLQFLISEHEIPSGGVGLTYGPLGPPNLENDINSEGYVRPGLISLMSLSDHYEDMTRSVYSGTMLPLKIIELGNNYQILWPHIIKALYDIDKLKNDPFFGEIDLSLVITYVVDSVQQCAFEYLKNKSCVDVNNIILAQVSFAIAYYAFQNLIKDTVGSRVVSHQFFNNNTKLCANVTCHQYYSTDMWQRAFYTSTLEKLVVSSQSFGCLCEITIQNLLQV